MMITSTTSVNRIVDDVYLMTRILSIIRMAPVMMHLIEWSVSDHPLMLSLLVCGGLCGNRSDVEFTSKARCTPMENREMILTRLFLKSNPSLGPSQFGSLMIFAC